MSIKHGRVFFGNGTLLTGNGKEDRPGYVPGKIYETDPAAVARLKRIMAQSAKPAALKEQDMTTDTALDFTALHTRYMALSVTDLRARAKALGLSAPTPAPVDPNGVVILGVIENRCPPMPTEKGKSKYDALTATILAQNPGVWCEFKLAGFRTAASAVNHFHKKELIARLAESNTRIDVRARKYTDEPDVSLLYARWMAL